MNDPKLMDKITALCKQRGFVFPGSEIYGGLANTWDYAPLGIALKNNVQQAWWNRFVRARPDMVGIETGILMNPKVWEASGHVANFGDPLVDCKKCKQRFRGDKLLEEKLGVEAAAVLTLDQVHPMLMAEKIVCPACGKTDWTPAKKFNLMFKTYQGVIEGEGNEIYLRPETAQGMFVQFKNTLQSMRMRLPFGIAQVGTVFRNEITPGNFTFRTREFQQMEIEYFIEPKEEMQHFEKWQKEMWQWCLDLGVSPDHLRIREHAPEERSHYSSKTIDIEYLFPWGWGELYGLANRSDYDLTQHEKHSGEDLRYTDPNDPARKFLPYVLEPTFGLTRTILMLLLEAYHEEQMPDGESRTVLKLKPHLAPVHVAILPLSKKDELVEPSQKIYQAVLRETNLNADIDVTGSIGKRYRRQDEIGTPFCVTVDFETLNDHAVTIRDRDTTKQDRIPTKDVASYVSEKCKTTV